MTYTGRCACGNVQFELTGEPMQVVICHCTVCQRSTGAPFVLVGMWKPEQTAITFGEPLPGRQTSDYLTRHSCSECGSAIYNAVRSERMDSDNFMIPLIENRGEGLQPTHHIYYANRSIDMDGGLPTFDRFKWMK